MTVNAWRVSCSGYSNWLGDALMDQSEIVLQSDLVRPHFHSRCKKIKCFASMFDIDFDQVLIVECFYRCVTLENYTNMLNYFFIFIYYSYYYLFNNRAMNCQRILKMLKSWAPPFWNYGKTQGNRRKSARIRRLGLTTIYDYMNGHIVSCSLVQTVTEWSHTHRSHVLKQCCVAGCSRLRLVCRPIISQ